MQVVYVLIALIMFSAFSVEAKTDQSADPNSGTGGTTVTGVTNTTNYEYRAPDLTVTAINGVPTSPSPVTSVPSTPEEKGRGYDTTMRSALKLPPEWFTCKTTSDCTLAHVPCSTSLAIGKAYKEKVQVMICKGECVDACLKSAPDTSLVSCDKGQCSTIIQPYKPADMK